MELAANPSKQIKASGISPPSSSQTIRIDLNNEITTLSILLLTYTLALDENSIL
jgi:hypothetical protein